MVLRPGQRHDSTQLESVLDVIRVLRPGGWGVPRKRPDRLIADKGYSYERCRILLWRRGTPHDPRAVRPAGPARPPAWP